VEKWDNYRKSQPNKQSLLLAHRWADVMDLNSKVRKTLQAEGNLPTEQVEINCAISNKVFTQQFAIGERIRLTKNDYEMELTNGDLGTITDIVTNSNKDLLFKVAIDSGKQITINTSSYCNPEGYCHIAQAYAMTVYSSQGLTVDGDTFIYYTSGMDRANTYVACSRHKDNSHLFVNKKEMNKLITAQDKLMHTDRALMKALSQKMRSNEKDGLASQLHKESQHSKGYKLDASRAPGQ
jgi:ATP-dependent exoDNAse (exonuclease V) alpha subunit